MLCPKCQNTLRERRKNGIRVDVCPACRGAWLQVGELEKLIDAERRYYELLDGDSYIPRSLNDPYGRMPASWLGGHSRVERYATREEDCSKSLQRGSFLSGVVDAFSRESD